MQTRTLLNLGLLAGLLTLVAIAYLEPGHEASSRSTPVTPLSPDDINRLTLLRRNATTMELERHPDGWTIDDTGLMADDFKVRSLLRLAREIPQRSYAASDTDLEQLGFHAPATRVKLNDITIRFGATTPLDKLRYIQSGDQVHLIQDMYLHLVEAGMNQWISRKLLPGSPALTRLVLPGLTVQKNAAGQWMTQPDATERESDALLALINHWQQATATGIRQDITTENRDVTTVQAFIAGTDTPLTFHVFPDGDHYWFLRDKPGIAYQLGSLTARQLLEPAPPTPAPAH